MGINYVCKECGCTLFDDEEQCPDCGTVNRDIWDKYIKEAKFKGINNAIYLTFAELKRVLGK